MQFDFKYYIERHPGQTLIDHEILFRKQLNRKGIPFDSAVQNITTSGITITETEYVLNALFRDKNEHVPGYRNRIELERTVVNEINRFRSRFSFNETAKSILERDQTTGSERNFTEYNGVAGSLIATNSLFGLTDADYSVIEESHEKTLDFRLLLASLGNRFVLIESKGVMGLDSRITAAANHIIAKKNDSDYLNHRDIYLGFITQIPFANENGNGKITLVDPEIPDLNLDARKVKFRNRIKYYINVISLLGTQRIYEYYYPIIHYVENTADKNWEEIADGMLEKKHPIRRFGPPFFSVASVDSENLPFRYMASIFPINNNEFFLVGFPHETLLDVLRSNVEEILVFKRKMEEVKIASARIRFRQTKYRIEYPDGVDAFGTLNIYSSGVTAGILKKRNN